MKVFVEKCIVKGRQDRIEGDYKLGKAIWSPTQGKKGADIYKLMREVNPGDLIIHLTDNKGIRGISEVVEKYSEGIGIENTEWAGVKAYFIKLRNYHELDPFFSRDDFLNQKHKKLLNEVKERSNVFYNKKLEFNQGAYLTESPYKLTEHLNECYETTHGKKLQSLDNYLKENFRQSIFDSLRKKIEDAGFIFEKEQVPHHQKRKEKELKFVHPKLIARFNESNIKVNAKKFYLKPLSDEPDCEIGFTTGKSSPLLVDDLFVKPNIIDDKDESPAWSNDENDNTLDKFLSSIKSFLDQKENINYWIFQGNPKLYDFETALRDKIITNWTVSAHKDKIKVGDKVILWITGSKSGCYALAEVTSEPYEKTSSTDDHLWNSDDKNELKADIKVTHNLADNPILKSDIESLEELNELKVGNQGTNFKATEDEYNTFLDLISSNKNSAYESVKNILDSNLVSEFIMVLRNYVKKNHLQPEDNRISFNVRVNKNRLVFIIGSRYAFSIEKVNKKTEVSFISKNALNKSSVSFTNQKKEIEAYWNKITSISDFQDNIKEGFEIELNRKNKTPHKRFTNKEFIEDIYQSKIIMGERTNYENIHKSLNTILYGPPGTGKTYHTILRAAEIIENRKIDNYEEALNIFKSNLHDRIEFITFHQNYSYEDFIQGLRPETDNKSSLVFEKKDGVFKKIADKALENLRLSKKDITELSKDVQFDRALEKFKETILEAEENYSINQTAYIFEVEEDAFRYTGEKWANHTNGLRMKFNDLQEFYRQGVTSRKDIKKMTSISGLANQHATYYYLVYEKTLSYLTDDVEVSTSVEKKNYVIIIDEINRANISRVFGELITLIEPDKRSHGAIPLEAKLPSGDTFMVPSNLFIIGTMNTADKSIALLDIALRRRFDFEAMFPLYDIPGKEIYNYDILKKINEQIIATKGHDFQIGHSYFMESKDLTSVMNKKVIPLLLEYYMNDQKEVEGILHKAGFEVDKNAWPLRITVKRD